MNTNTPYLVPDEAIQFVSDLTLSGKRTLTGAAREAKDHFSLPCTIPVIIRNVRSSTYWKDRAEGNFFAHTIYRLKSLPRDVIAWAREQSGELLIPEIMVEIKVRWFPMVSIEAIRRAACDAELKFPDSSFKTITERLMERRSMLRKQAKAISIEEPLVSLWRAICAEADGYVSRTVYLEYKAVLIWREFGGSEVIAFEHFYRKLLNIAGRYSESIDGISREEGTDKGLFMTNKSDCTLFLSPGEMIRRGLLVSKDDYDFNRVNARYL